MQVLARRGGFRSGRLLDGEVSQGARSEVHCSWRPNHASPCRLHACTQLKAIQLIKDAEIIVYDELGTQDALGFASEQCEKIYVGKRGGRPSVKQWEIDDILVQACSRVSAGCLHTEWRAGR
jgi:hypothetical protein